MSAIHFRPITFADRELIRRYAYDTECRNCDLNFLNLMSWHFLYHTEMAEHKGTLLFRFLAEGELSYLVPVGPGDWNEPIDDMIAESHDAKRPFVLRGVCDNSLAHLHAIRPNTFVSSTDRNHSDYIYARESLATLAGKKLQPKRNLANRFEKNYPHYVYEPLTPAHIPACMELAQLWNERKSGDESREQSLADLQSMQFVLDHWIELEAEGGVLMVDGKVVAFTYGSPINYDTYGVCIEKADVSYEGAFAAINRDFCRHIPERYRLINREEDLGIEGLRQAKLAYRPETILTKHTVRLSSEKF